MTDRIVHLRIAGRVQGVGYRDFLRGEAEARGLAGWVRNRRDGTVEAVVSGSTESIDEFVAACWRGPPASRVSAVDKNNTSAAALEGRAKGFSVLPTI
jgi:acylphosphatase